MGLSIVLTHDVDSVRKPVSHVLRVWRRFRTVDLIKHLLHLTNLYNNIEDLMRIEDSCGVRSTIFFPVSLFSIEEVLDLVRTLQRGGWEIGLHVVIEPIQTVALVRQQYDLFTFVTGVRPLGVRSHYLIFRRELVPIYRELGIVYDSTLRVEESKSFDPFSLDDLIELPIAVMDADLFGRYRLSEEVALRYIYRRIEEAKDVGAKYFTILFHQESLRMRGGRIYSRLIKELSQRFSIVRCIDVVKEVRGYV